MDGQTYRQTYRWTGKQAGWEMDKDGQMHRQVSWLVDGTDIQRWIDKQAGWWMDRLTNRCKDGQGRRQTGAGTDRHTDRCKATDK